MMSRDRFFLLLLLYARYGIDHNCFACMVYLVGTSVSFFLRLFPICDFFLSPYLLAVLLVLLLLLLLLLLSAFLGFLDALFVILDSRFMIFS